MMLIKNMVHSMKAENKFGEGKNVTLHPDQVFKGKVLKVFSNNIALIQLGNIKFQAQLNSMPQANKNYWFEVQSSKSMPPLLTMLDTSGQVKKSNVHEAVRQILENFGLKDVNKYSPLMKVLIERDVPFSKSQLIDAINWTSKQKSQDFHVIEYVFRNGLPTTKTVFESIRSATSNSSLTLDLIELLNLLKGSDQKEAEYIKLQELLNQLTKPNNKAAFEQTPKDGNFVLQMMNKQAGMLGMTYEQNLAKSQISDSIKPILLKLINDSDISLVIKERAEHLVHRITGLQLLATSDNGPLTSILLQIPFLLNDHVFDATIQFQGNKKQNGEIDPDFCRILFYLEFQQMKETAIDLFIQNRVIHVRIFNENNQLEQLIKEMEPVLKTGLQHLNYQLSTVKLCSFKELDKPDTNSQSIAAQHLTNQSYVGVDYKI